MSWWKLQLKGDRFLKLYLTATTFFSVLFLPLSINLSLPTPSPFSPASPPSPCSLLPPSPLLSPGFHASQVGLKLIAKNDLDFSNPPLHSVYKVPVIKPEVSRMLEKDSPNDMAPQPRGQQLY